ncbi:MAG TPA: malectin domain-containing carbohydrate-binding protein [Candidatus Bathyarchaeia archaeon]|nr:malectin domain-containing carbohydrate-binding protein [Candidatus Bathyarchaeia archaeon]
MVFLKPSVGLVVLAIILCAAVSHADKQPAAAIVSPPDASHSERLAAAEIRRYVYVCTGILLPIVDATPASGDVIVAATVAKGLAPQEYTLVTRQEGKRRILRLAGGSDTATLYAAYRFAEHLGVRFYMHGDVIPDKRVKFEIPAVNEQAKPLFELRGIQPFHDFPEGPDWWNTDQYKAILSQLPKMRMNFFGLHTYPEDRPAAEPTVWIGMPEHCNEDGSVNASYPSLYYNTAMTAGWGFGAKKTSDYKMGAAALYDRDGYGSDAIRGFEPRPEADPDCNALFDRTGVMFRDAFDHARALGIKTCVGTETPLVAPRRVQARVGHVNPAFEVQGGNVAAYGAPIEGTEDDAVYQTCRWSLNGYTFPVPDGSYTVRLMFCETHYDIPGARVFNVSVQGRRVIEKLDVFAKVGKNVALDYAFDNIKPVDGRIAITFEPVVENPFIAGIEIVGADKTIRVNCGGPALKDFMADTGDLVVAPDDVQRLYEGMFTRIMRAYPIDYYWFWTPEGWTWQGTSEATVQATIDDINLARAGASAVGAPFQLATCGWVLGPQYDRALFDKVLPKDMPVSCINRQVGHEPVDPGFANVQGRGKWAIPWLEDDPALHSPQLWAGRMRRDACDALTYGCTGLMGIHWRTRILSPNVSALAQAAWSQEFDDPRPSREGVEGGGSATAKAKEFTDTDNDALYRTARKDVNAYHILVPNGRYRVTLQFCEPEHAEIGKRVFDVKLEGETVLTRLDIFEHVGSGRALDFEFGGVAVKDGRMDIEFVRRVDVPCIAAVSVEGANAKRRINCGGPALADYEKDLEPIDLFIPAADFYADWARAEFGPNVAGKTAKIFARIDCHLPRPSDWTDGPGGYRPDNAPWSRVEKDYAYVDEFAGLRKKVKSPGHLDRFDYWLANFRFMRASARMKCAWGAFNKALGKAKQAPAAEQARLARDEAVPARVELVGAVREMYAELLKTVSTTGEMGSITNLEQHTLPHVIEKPGVELEALLGGPLPPEAQLPADYAGPARIIVPVVRTSLEQGEPLNIVATVLAEMPPGSVSLYWRPLGQGEFTEVPLAHVARAMYATMLSVNEDIEYYIKAADAVWPATAPELNQTLVVVADS